MKKIFKKILLFFTIFLIAFFSIHVLGFANGYGDPINSYGFAKAISMGQVPYLEFNTISTPLYAMYQSLFLYIYDDFLMINLSQALLITVSVILIYKMFGRKSLLLLLVVSFFQYRNLVATYNFMSLFFIFLLMYMEEKYPDKDYLIGFFIGLSVMSKQTVGCFMIFPSIIFYYKDIKKLLRRFVGFFVSCFSFVIYLLINGALYKFFDLCFLGLFDFLNKNGVGGGHIYVGWFILTVLTFIISIIIVFKNKKNISNYYLILGVLFTFPLFDITHVAFWMTCFVMLLLPLIRKKEKQLIFISTVVSLTFMILFFCSWNLSFDLCVTKNINHFKYNIHSKRAYNNLLNIDKFIDSYHNPVVIGYYSMMYSITNDKKFSYFDVLYDGNYGYNGIKKMKKRIDKMHDQIFIVSMTDYNNEDEFSQFSKEIAKYIINNSQKIDSKYSFDVYYKE